MTPLNPINVSLMARPKVFSLLSPLLLAFLFGTANTAFAAPNERQLTLLSNNCLQCHAAPHISAPQLGHPKDWKDINAQGEETVLKHVVEGIGGMPPLGYCSACDEQDLRELIYLITGMQPAKHTSMQHSKESL
jgi:cytochrome c5